MSVANKFVGDGVKFVVGHFNSGVTMPASDVYAENGILFITPSATNPKITDRKLWDAFRAPIDEAFNRSDLVRRQGGDVGQHHHIGHVGGRYGRKGMLLAHRIVDSVPNLIL